jgi:hypothetical protein
MMSFLIKTAMPYSFYHGSQQMADSLNLTNSAGVKEALKYGMLSLGYLLVYPF